MYELKHPNNGIHTRRSRLELLSEAYLEPSGISAMELFGRNG